MKKIEVFTIDTHVPIPEHQADWGTLPLGRMKVGDSFLFPVTQRGTVQSKASLLKRRDGNKFTVKQVSEDECRIWKVS